MQMRSDGVSCRERVFDIVMRFSEGISHRKEKGKLGMVQEGLKRWLGLFNPWRSKICGKNKLTRSLLRQNSIYSHTTQELLNSILDKTQAQLSVTFGLRVSFK